MRTQVIIIFFALFFILSLITGCKVNKSMTGSNYAGDWKFIASTGTSGTLRISRDGSGFSGLLITGYGENPLHDLTIESGHLTGTFEVMGTIVRMEGDFNKDEFNGRLISSDGNHTISAVKILTDH